mmetsp:Transcript_22526/g.39822  ORF Transcript_22526/g.39822 Transcript_22526/m.39822 type:complete len:97 (-) Transcript_22526:483-773(-)
MSDSKISPSELPRGRLSRRRNAIFVNQNDAKDFRDRLAVLMSSENLDDLEDDFDAEREVALKIDSERENSSLRSRQSRHSQSSEQTEAKKKDTRDG